MDGKKVLTWRYTFIPIYALNYGLGAFIALYVLAIGGSVFDVGVAIAVYYTVSIPSSLIFGGLTDMSNRTKPFIVYSTVFTLPIVAAFVFPNTIPSAWLLYAVYAVVFSAANPALNVLVMGREAKRRKMPRYYGKYGLFSVVGLMIASLLGVFVQRNQLQLYLAFLLAFNLAAVALALLLIKDQPVLDLTEERRQTRKTFSLLNLTDHRGIVELNLVERLQRALRHHGPISKRKRSLHWLLFAIALFNAGYYVFYASYIPFQIAAGLSYSAIFVIQLFNAFAQAAAFILILEMIKRPRLHLYFVSSSAVRAIVYMLMLASLFVPLSYFFELNLAAYAIGGFVIAFWNLSSAVLLYHRIKGVGEGRYLGIWSGLGSGAAIIGSFASGFLSSTFGYSLTLSIAVILTAAAGIAFAAELKEH